eukprot:4225124-Amphidinium_carterae.1
MPLLRWLLCRPEASWTLLRKRLCGCVSPCQPPIGCSMRPLLVLRVPHSGPSVWHLDGRGDQIERPMKEKMT